MATSAYNTVTVATSATAILTAKNERRGMVIYNNGANTVYIGFDTSVTTSNGLPILPQSSFELNGDRCWRGSVYGVSTSVTDDVRYWEWLQ